MITMEKILVPTDFSPCAKNAVEVALKIAAKAGAQITFQHLHADSSGKTHVPTKKKATADATLSKVKSKLDKLVLQAKRLGIDAKPLLVINKGTDSIENYIGPMGFTLVVMGSHGATGIRELIIGSQTQRVVRNSVAPVLVVKNKSPRINFKDVLFATTFMEDPSRAIHPAVKLAELWKGTVHLLYLGLEDDKQTKAEVERKMKSLESRFPTITFTRNFITTNDAEWGMKHVVKDIEPDAISLTMKLKTGGLIFNHSLAERLVNHESLPVLVINTPN